MCSLILGRRTRRNRSVRIKGQSLTIEGNNGEEDVMGKVTWLPVQELIKGWTDSEVLGLSENNLINRRAEGDVFGKYEYRSQVLRPYGDRKNLVKNRTEMRPRFNSRGRGDITCYNCGGQGHMVRDCQETKCFGCGKRGHIAPFCSQKQEKLRCAGCGRFGHNKEN
ncbi:uncharacterized protein LOC135924479 [Gordionus sp. m RMFG-2023]|uniref:uncharacterized protein LOC135924479 n=1 Tax=Gordionus sp. m RMFG-2023 TaxID=3053472 RepID=UPI0031FBAAC6